ncbi:MAG: hypothetical protein JRH18_25145 [Deltaproteobacteria bacterium]|nr:hypothetical protein [Deltaproteobacteria bacterium]MBW1962832.1 hypothetical protein [Deltaproteobacteria bacterium]MBW2154931.1 hypothetical protein [Deltaproteobacteria bacterium]
MGIEKVSALNLTLLNELKISNGPKPFNLQLQDSIESRLMIDVARMILEAAYRRCESRGAHYRSDYPDTKDEWKTNLIVTKKGQGVHCEKVTG